MMNRKSVFLGALVSCWFLSTSAVFADFALTTADFGPAKKITVNEWSLKDTLSYSDASAALGQVATRDVVSLKGDAAVVPAADAWRLVLRNRDVLVGVPAGTQDQNMLFTTAAAGTLQVPFKNVASLESPAAANVAATAASDQDTLRLKNGDTLSGIVASIAADKITLSTTDATGAAANTDVPLDKVVRMTLGGATPPRALPPLSARLTLTDGSVLTTTAFSWRVAEITYNDSANAEHKIAADMIAGVDVLGGRVVSLTDLDPVKESQVATFGTTYPMQVNRNVIGGPLKVGGVAYPRGLGVHAASTLTYEIDPSFTRLLFRAGVDDSAVPFGIVDAKIAADGKTVWEASGLVTYTTGHTAQAARVEAKLAGARHLELIALPSKHLDVQGRLDWIDPVLIRP